MSAAAFGRRLLAVVAALALLASAADPPPTETKTADDFAETILQAAQVFEEEHIKQPSRQELVALAIRGLYRSLNEPIPYPVAVRLKRIKRLKDDELKTLLRDARHYLGKRAALDDLRD